MARLAPPENHRRSSPTGRRPRGLGLATRPVETFVPLVRIPVPLDCGEVYGDEDPIVKLGKPRRRRTGFRDCEDVHVSVRPINASTHASVHDDRERPRIPPPRLGASPGGGWRRTHGGVCDSTFLTSSTDVSCCSLGRSRSVLGRAHGGRRGRVPPHSPFATWRFSTCADPHGRRRATRNTYIEVHT
jgi:hypothetical protein